MEHQFAPTDPYCPILLPNIYPSIKLSIQYMLQEVLLQREGQGLCETSKALSSFPSLMAIKLCQLFQLPLQNASFFLSLQ